MDYVEKSNGLQFHYYFLNNSHSINSIVRNECEKEILYIFREIADTLGLELLVETLPSQEGGFKEIWKFLGRNSAQITLIASIAAIVISRFPVENKELTKLQIENLKLDNELKRKELEKLNLQFIQEDDKISKDKIADSVELVNKNYKVSWRKSNLYRKLSNYHKVNYIDVLRLDDDEPIGSSRKVLKKDFSKFILRTDDLPNLELEKVNIDVISPAIKRGKFRWKGFFENEIINFLMNDSEFLSQVLSGNIKFSNRYSIEVSLTQERKINQDGNVVVINSIVNKVFASVEGEKRIDY